MPNELDETDVSTINHEGRDIHVIEKKITVTLDGADKAVNVGVWFIFIIGGVIYGMRKAKALSYFQQLQQKIQHAASTIDNYLLQRVNILQNTAKLVEKAVDLDKSTFAEIARLRSGAVASDEARIELAEKLNAAEKSINLAFENYPELKANENFLDLQAQLEGTENRIAEARRAFNETAKEYNTAVRRFPNNLLASIFGFSSKGYFEADEAAKTAPKVEF